MREMLPYCLLPLAGTAWARAGYMPGHLPVPGRLGIGVAPAGMNSLRLAVDGLIGARGVKVAAPGAAWPDYVFHPGYRLRPLADVARYTRRYGHLPDVPSAAEVAREGLDLAATQAALLRKVEELTLYVVALERQSVALRQRVRRLERRGR